MTLNDGCGLYDNEGVCDTLINDCNNLVKQIATGQYISFCVTIVEIVQKVSNLKKGIHADMESKDRTIEELKQALRNAGNVGEYITPEGLLAEQSGKAGATDGTN